MVRIFIDDPNIPYKSTELKAAHTKSEIDGLFGKWGIKDTYWRWDPQNNDVFVVFKLHEIVNSSPVDISVKVDAIPIWNHQTKKVSECINWDVSMRQMFWFIKATLQAAYIQQISKAASFLPHIIGDKNNQTMKDLIIPRLSQVTESLVLEEKQLQKVNQLPNNIRMVNSHE